MDTLLVGVENTEEGRDGLRFAKSLSQATGARIHAISVDPTIVYYLGESDMEESRRTYFAHAKSLVEAEIGADFEFHTAVEIAPASGIGQTADEVDADLIVVGSCHRGPVGRVLMGDTAALLVAGSSRPVAVVPRGSGKPDGAGNFGRIGVGVDGSRESEEALAFARDLASLTDSQLDLIGVVRRIVPAVPYAAAYTTAQGNLKSRMDELLHRAAGEIANLETRIKVSEGIPSDQLVLASVGLDLLVLGSRGYGAAKRVLLGSTSLPVMRGASCPVIVVPKGHG